MDYSLFFKKITKSRLSYKFTLFFIILSATPLLALGGITLYLIDFSHQRDVSSLELQLIDQKTEEIEKFFADTIGVLELHVGFTQIGEIKLEDQRFLLDGLVNDNRAFEEVSLINLAGQETAKKQRGAGSVELYDVSNLSKFKKPSAGDNFIGNVYFTLSGPMITLSAPVRNKNGEVIQVLSAEVNLSQVVRSMESSRLGTSGYILLMDRNGALISSRQRHYSSPGTDFSWMSRVRTVLQGNTYDGLGKNDRYKSALSKLNVVGAGKRVPVTHWALLVEWPIEDADLLIQNVRYQLSVFTLFSILAILLLAPIFTARLVRPIKMLESGAVEIEKGNFESLVKIETNDELEDLGGAFNNMAQGLKRLQELKNEFVFIAAHELRTPVTAIRGYVSMVLEGDAGILSEKLKQYLTPVSQASDRLVELINNVLEIARSEAGKMKIEVAVMNPEEAIGQIVAETEPLAKEKKISLIHSEEKLPHIVADPSRLKEILANLISNAIKYNREGGWIKISHEIKEDAVITHVADNGLGMSPEEQQHLFEKFFRSSEVKSIQGTGLGLFITKGLVEKMGGKIWFSSEQGEGTTFSFSLPKA